MQENTPQLKDWNYFEKKGFDLIGFWLEMIMRADFALRHDKHINLKKNENFRGMYDILSNAIDIFRQENPEITLTYARDKDFVTLDKFLQINSHTLSADELDEAFIPTKLKQHLTGKTIGEAIIFILLPQTTIKGFHKIHILRQLLVTTAPNGFKKAVQESSSYDIEADLGKTTGTTLATQRKEKMKLAMNNLEKTVTEKGGPQSIATLFINLLKYNNGSIDESISQLAWLVKYVTRNSERLNHNLDWTKNNLLDEFSPYLSYQYIDHEHEGGFGPFGKLAVKTRQIFVQNDPPEIWADASYKNQIGKAYHAAYILSLLRYCEPEVIGLMVSAEFASSGPGHGANKAMSDLLILKNIKRINALFASYIHK